MSDCLRLLLPEHAHHVDEMVARGWSNGRWVALGPGAMAALEARGIDYRIPEDFHRSDELEAVCRDLHGRVERACGKLDAVLAARGDDLRAFTFNIFPLVVLADSVGGRVFQLARILRANEGLVPTIHHRPAQPPGEYGLLFSPEERLWGRALELLDAAADFLPEPGRRATIARSVPASLRRTVGASAVLTTIALGVRRRAIRSALRALVTRGDRVLVVNPSAEWMHVLPQLEAAGVSSIFALENRFAPRSQLSVEPLDPAAVEICAELTVEDVSIQPVITDRLELVWSHARAEHDAAARAFARISRRTRIRAVLRSSAAGGVGHSTNEAARSAGVPVCTWQHGMITTRHGISQFREYADMMTSDLVLAFGEDSAAAYRRSSPRWPHARVAPVGSPTLDALPHRKAGGTPRILYATTNYAGNEWYVGYSPPLSDRHLFRDQLAIIETLERLAGERLCEACVKLHPATVPPWAADAKRTPGLTVITGEHRFPELVAESDLVVIDFPSTTLLQALAGGARTFVLLRYCRPSESAERLLARTAAVAFETEELCEAIETHLRGGDFPADPTDTAFLRACGTHRDDGSSADRAMLEILRTVSKTS